MASIIQLRLRIRMMVRVVRGGALALNPLFDQLVGNAILVTQRSDGGSHCCFRPRMGISYEIPIILDIRHLTKMTKPDTDLRSRRPDIVVRAGNLGESQGKMMSEDQNKIFFAHFVREAPIVSLIFR